MQTRIVRIGNSQGVRLPRPLLEIAGLGPDIVVRATPGRIIIESARGTRAGWSDAAKAMHEAGDDTLMDTASPSTFDDEEWEWR